MKKIHKNWVEILVLVFVVSLYPFFSRSFYKSLLENRSLDKEKSVKRKLFKFSLIGDLGLAGLISAFFLDPPLGIIIGLIAFIIWGIGFVLWKNSILENIYFPTP